MSELLRDDALRLVDAALAYIAACEELGVARDVADDLRGRISEVLPVAYAVLAEHEQGHRP